MRCAPRPELAANVPDELLRHDGTVQLAGRFATTDVVFGETTIPAGESIFVMLGAANRDPDRFPDPDRIDFGREKIQPLAFGGGVHLCLGAPLARLEIEVVFRKLAERFETIELGGELPPHRDRLTLRSPTAVPLKFRSTSSAAGLAARPSGDDAQWRVDYRRFLDEQPEALDPAERKARIALLKRVPFFRPCSAADLETLAATAYPISFDAGEHLCVEGADTPDCYVIAAGEADIFIAGERVATIGADDVVGERGLLLDAPARGDRYGDLAHDHLRHLAGAAARCARRVARRRRRDANRGRAALPHSVTARSGGLGSPSAPSAPTSA